MPSRKRDGNGQEATNRPTVGFLSDELPRFSRQLPSVKFHRLPPRQPVFPSTLALLSDGVSQGHIVKEQRVRSYSLTHSFLDS